MQREGHEGCCDTPLARNENWDAAKDTVNRRKHGVSFDQAKRAFEDPNRVILEDAGHSSAAQHQDHHLWILEKRKGNIWARKRLIRIVTRRLRWT